MSLLKQLASDHLDFVTIQDFTVVVDGQPQKRQRIVVQSRAPTDDSGAQPTARMRKLDLDALDDFEAIRAIPVDIWANRDPRDSDSRGRDGLQDIVIVWANADRSRFRTHILRNTRNDVRISGDGAEVTVQDASSDLRPVEKTEDDIESLSEPFLVEVDADDNKGV